MFLACEPDASIKRAIGSREMISNREGKFRMARIVDLAIRLAISVLAYALLILINDLEIRID